MRTTAGFVCMVIAIADAFELPNFFKLPTKNAGTSVKAVDVAPLKKQLLEAIPFTSNGKNATPEKQAQVLKLVGEIEGAAPPPPTLLSDPEAARQLDGTWYLQYTSPSVVGDKDEFPNEWKPDFASEGDSNINTKQFQSKGSITAVGIEVDTSNRVVKQILDINSSRVTNDIELDFGRVVVSGPFRPSPNVPNRAIVAFDTADITLKNGFTLKLGFLFAILAVLRGSKDNGWLETTHIGDDMRIGRDNKGTMFVLTRDVDAVQP